MNALIEDRLQESMDSEVHDGTSSDRFFFHSQVREGISVLRKLRAAHAASHAEAMRLAEELRKLGWKGAAEMHISRTDAQKATPESKISGRNTGAYPDLEIGKIRGG